MKGKAELALHHIVQRCHFINEMKGKEGGTTYAKGNERLVYREKIVSSTFHRWEKSILNGRLSPDIPPSHDMTWRFHPRNSDSVCILGLQYASKQFSTLFAFITSRITQTGIADKISNFSSLTANCQGYQAMTADYHWVCTVMDPRPRGLLRLQGRTQMSIIRGGVIWLGWWRQRSFR